MSPTLCPCCPGWQAQLRTDSAGRARACPTCGSLERHRVLALLLPALAGFVGADTPDRLVVDVAPSRAVDRVLDRLPPSRRVRMDFDPAADGREVDLRASVTAMPFADRSVNLLVCSHVLEHVPDDAAAMAEIARVLATGGIGLVAVPLRRGPTDEDPDTTPQERLARFGQADHVRYYGDDFDDRLQGAGLQTRSLTSADLLPPWLLELMRLVPEERFHLVATAGTRMPTLPELTPLVFGVLGTYLAESGGGAETLRSARAESQRWQAAAVRWEERYIRLRERRAVRAISAVDRIRNRARALLRREG